MEPLEQRQLLAGVSLSDGILTVSGPDGQRNTLTVSKNSAGQYVAKKFGAPYDEKRLLSDQTYNMQLGAAELGDLIVDYRGSYILTFAGFAMGKEVHGTWRLVGDEFCWMQRKFTAVEECFEVERRGNQIRFLRDGYEAFSGNLSPIKAQVPTRVPR